MSESRILLHEFANFVAVANGHENVGEYEVGIQIGEAADGGFAVAD